MHPHKFSIKHIAAQAAVSVATVDRVINNRPGVRAYTRRRVLNAIEELETYETEIGFFGNQIYIDIILNAHQCFCDLVQEAFLRSLSSFRTFSLSPRFHCFTNEKSTGLSSEIDRIIDNGSHGLVVTAANDPLVRDSIDYAHAKDIPVVTFGSDIPYSKRFKFVGANGYAEGQTAAYLAGQWLKNDQHRILVCVAESHLLNQVERETGFRQYIRQHHKDVEMDVLTGLDTADQHVFEQVWGYLNGGGSADAVYSVGTPSQSILDAYEKVGRKVDFFIAHNLDENNKNLIKESRISAVLDRNVDIDAHNTLLSILNYHNQIKYSSICVQGPTNVITPCNLATG